MKKLISILFILLNFTCVAQDTTLTKAIIANTAVTSITYSSKLMYFIGNSITLGAQSSDTFHRWVNLVVAAKGGIDRDMGISGQTMQGNGCTTVFDKTTIPSYNSATDAVLFISLGINDVRQNNGFSDPEAFGIVYDFTIKYAINTKSWPAYKIKLLTPYWMNATGYAGSTGTCGVTVAPTIYRHEQYVTKVLEVGHNNGCQVIDIYSAMRDSPANGTFLYTDGLHPVDAGHAFIANFVISKLAFYWWLFAIPMRGRLRKMKPKFKQAA